MATPSETRRFYCPITTFWNLPAPACCSSCRTASRGRSDYALDHIHGRRVMGLLNKLFGRTNDGGDTQPQSSQFHESETTAQDHNSANAPHRELVHVVLRDTMRKH